MERTQGLTLKRFTVWYEAASSASLTRSTSVSTAFKRVEAPKSVLHLLRNEALSCHYTIISQVVIAFQTHFSRTACQLSPKGRRLSVANVGE